MDRRRVQIVRFEKVARGLFVLTIILFLSKFFTDVCMSWAMFGHANIFYLSLSQTSTLLPPCINVWQWLHGHCHHIIARVIVKNEKPEILGAKLGFSLLWHYMHLLIINTGVILYYWPNSLPNGWAIYIYLRTRWIYKVVETYKFMQP